MISEGFGLSSQDWIDLMDACEQGDPAALARFRFLRGVMTGELRGWDRRKMLFGNEKTGKMMKVTVERIPASPPGVHYTLRPRIGDAQRDETLERLGEGLAGGFIGQPEYEARSGAALKAQTEEELASLVQDLTGLPEKKKLILKKEEPKAKIYKPLPSGRKTLAFVFLISLFADTRFSGPAFIIYLSLGLFFLGEACWGMRAWLRNHQNPSKPL